MARFRARTAAHLRSRGEDSSSSSTSTATSASSPPLARRGLGDRVPGTPLERLTSARAERTAGTSTRTARTPAHLRSRGEDAASADVLRLTPGSPPLARRGHGRGRARGGWLRLTSARAERTATLRIAVSRIAAHLRSRGEDSRGAGGGHAASGSPPLARRGPQGHHGDRHHRRLTSARAERTNGAVQAMRCRPAHLRSRGEDKKHVLFPIRDFGSPPLARRGLGHRACRCLAVRLTSARAERTIPAPRDSGGKAAHLRSRGEDSGIRRARASSTGSPPLARRGRGGRGLHARRGWLTSARAERTGYSGLPGPLCQAHLRSRGEDTLRPALLIRLFHCFTDDSRQGMGLGCVGPADSAYAVWPGRGQTA